MKKEGVYEKLDTKPNLREVQKEVLDFWNKNETFMQSLKNKKSEVTFVDGPPFPTGKPHHGTILVSFIKDMIARYQTMRGFSVPRVWGWDCHGLPIETQAEGILGIKNKAEIENSVGVDKFNNACFDIVSKNNDAWKTYIGEAARWVDYDGAYKTMNTDFMESVLWTFKQCYDKGLIYKDYRVTPYCYRCETSLSISDTRESDSTRPRQDPWVISKFKTQTTLNNKPVYLLAWTTTPWTLPSNLALAVGADIEYAFVDMGEEVFVAGVRALSKYEKVFGKSPKIIKKCLGKELVGQEYEPLLDYFKHKAKEGAFKVILADFIDANEGTGLAHEAPAFGEDDYWVCKANGIPIVNPVDAKGRFTDEVKDFKGRNVIEANQDIIRFLRAKNLVVDAGTLEHNYPHCWRCRDPLIYKAMDAWYFSIDKIKDKLIKSNNLINWVPDSVKINRFGSWLEGARDWNISRNRYWSTPIPVWECDKCHERTVLGSIDEIHNASGVKLDNLHKQFMDSVTLKCKCGGTKKRVPEVLDCWFESGAVPHAAKHYPFENKEWFDAHSPCDFVVEYTGQIRCWFYYLHVLSIALFNKPAFKNAVVHGTVLAKDGKKLSKSSKNYSDPMELMQKYGTDAFRLYMFQSNAMLVGDMLFDESGLHDMLQQIILPFWNACGFFNSYAIIDNFKYEGTQPNSDNQLDQWILAKLYDAQKNITENMDKYFVDKYISELVPLIEGLTNWYIRRSRRRFWGSEFTTDKKNAYETLAYVLVNICKLMAPVAPIISEKLYKHLSGEESVHLAAWPQISKMYENKILLEKVGFAQKIIHLAHSIRTKNNIKNRQPLGKLQVATASPDKIAIITQSKQVICEELNVKEIEIITDIKSLAEVKYLPNFAVLSKKYGAKTAEIIKEIKEGKIEGKDDEDVLVQYIAREGLHVADGQGIVVALDLTITEDLLQEGIAKDIVRTIQDARKQLGCEISDRIGVRFRGVMPPQNWVSYIYSETLSKDFAEPAKVDFTCTVETEKGSIIIEVAR